MKKINGRYLAVGVGVAGCFLASLVGVFSLGVMHASDELVSVKSQVKALEIAQAADQSNLKLSQNRSNDMQCLSYLFKDQDLVNVKRRVCKGR